LMRQKIAAAHERADAASAIMARRKQHARAASRCPRAETTRSSTCCSTRRPAESTGRTYQPGRA
jgi:hypothetical protein